MPVSVPLLQPSANALDRQTKFVAGAMFFSGILLLVYSCIRAATLTFTYDEIYSLQHVRSGFELYASHYERMAANNHWLNSFFIWVISHITTKNFFLRIPQLFAHAIFLFCSGKLLWQVRRDFFALTAFLLLNLNPYLLDFFSLARGYGLSLGCMLGAIYCAIQFTNRNDWIYVAGTLFFSAMSVFASFVLLNFFAVLIPLTMVIIQLRKADRPTRLKMQLFLLGGLALVVAFVVPHLLKMQEADALYFGSSEFWNGSVKSLIGRLLYEKYGITYFASAQIVLYFLLLIILIGTLMHLRKTGTRRFLQSVHGIFFMLLSGCVLLTFAQGWLLHTLYPQERTGLYLFVLLLFTFLLSLHTIFRSTPTAEIFAGILLVPVGFHFIHCVNLTYCLDWTPAGNADKILTCIIQDRETHHPGQAIVLNSDPVAGNATTYLVHQQGIDWLTINLWWDESQFTKANYYLREKYSVAFRDVSGKRLIYSDPLTGNELYAEP